MSDVNPINQEIWLKVFNEEEETELKRKRNNEIVLKKNEMEWLKEHNPNKFKILKERQDRLRDLKKWFDCFDSDGSGTISADELIDPLLSLGLAKDVKEVQKMIQEVDDSGDGELEFEEFVKIFGSHYENHPIVKMLRLLDSGICGDPKLLSIQSLIARYRRMRLIEGLHEPLSEKNENVLGIRRAMEYQATTLERQSEEEEKIMKITPDMIIHKSQKLRKQLQKETAPPPVSYVRSYITKGYYSKIPASVVLNRKIGNKNKPKNSIKKESKSIPLLPKLKIPEISPVKSCHPNQIVYDQKKADSIYFIFIDSKDLEINRNTYKKTFSRKALQKQNEQLKLQNLDISFFINIFRFINYVI